MQNKTQNISHLRQVTAIGIIIGLLISMNAFAAEAQSNIPPGQHFNLDSYKLQTPVAQRDSVEEIAQPNLKNYASSYFYFDSASNAIVFYCPDNGATTRGSHFPRTELRNVNEWTFSGQHTLTATLAVTQQPESGGIIVGQIHGTGGGTEALKIRWSNGDIVAGVKTTPGSTEDRYTLVRGMKLGDRFSYTIAQSDHTVTVTVNGASKSFLFEHSWDAEQIYFKAGNYLQDNSGSGSAGIVKFFSLSGD